MIVNRCPRPGDVRRWALAGCALVAFAPAFALAQEETASSDTVTVTGSRIARTGMTTPTPVTSLSAGELDELAPTTLIESLEALPQFVNSDTPANALGTSGAAGQSLINLRGVGSNRTLTLLDGRRIVPSTRRGTTDVSILPQNLIQRVEVVTGGASAAYGSDAVAGVVNFLLDTDYEGLKGEVQGGISEQGDAENFTVSSAFGTQIGQRGHLLLSGEYYRNEGVENYRDRDWFNSWGVILNPDPNGPDRITVPNVGSAIFTNGGLIREAYDAAGNVVPNAPISGTRFLSDGTPAPFTIGDYYNSARPDAMVGGDAIDPGIDNTLLPEQERQTAFAYFDYEFSPNFTWYVQALYGRSETSYLKDPSYLVAPWNAQIYVDNAYLPESVRQQMIASGVESFHFSRYGSRDDLTVAMVNTVNETQSYTTGFDAELAGWRLNAYYQYGDNGQRLNYRDTTRIDRIFQSLDSVVDPATGQVVCRSTLTNPGNGCVPSSFFGDGAVNDEAREWILDDNAQVQNVTQHFTEFTMDREIFEGWAGPVSLALGASYREDDFELYGDPYDNTFCTPEDEDAGYRGLPASYSNCYGLFERANPAPNSGSSNVWEAFGETIVPLLRDRPFAQSLDFQGAVRYADYSGSGGIWAWKAGLDWTPVDDLRLRGTLSRDVRAGTLSERFDQTNRGATVDDPETNSTYSITQLEGGNPNIEPEKADTLTVGAVYSPSWFEGFDLSVDYYDIKIEGAIGLLGVQRIIDDCYDGATELCALIERDPNSNLITLVENTFLNIAEERARGIDVEAAYRTPLSVLGRNGDLALRALASFTLEASTTNVGVPKRDVAGVTGGGGVPEVQATLSATYSEGPFSLNLTERYISGGDRYYGYVEGVDIDNNDVEAAWYTNARLSYDFDAGGNTYQLFFAVTNLFDKDPPVAASWSGFFGSSHTNGSLFDEVGRRYTAGLRFEF